MAVLAVMPPEKNVSEPRPLKFHWGVVETAHCPGDVTIDPAWSMKSNPGPKEPKSKCCVLVRGVSVLVFITMLLHERLEFGGSGYCGGQ